MQEDGRAWRVCQYSSTRQLKGEYVPDLRKFDSEVTDQDELGAFPLFPSGWNLLLDDVSRCSCATDVPASYALNLVLVEHGHLVDYDPW